MYCPQVRYFGIIIGRRGNDPFLGPANELVTIVEFSDYEYPFSSCFRDQTLNQNLEIHNGKVRSVYRDFPLINFHPQA